MTFEQLGLCPPILRALTQQGYQSPSPIQEKAIPPALAGQDVLGCAQTGTGKTCAFAAPILQRLHSTPQTERRVRALILTPTRELAIQIGDSFKAYGAFLPLRHAVIFGGVSQNPQVQKLKQGVDLLVATPGRLADLYQQRLLDLSHVEIFVLDEADRMLDMGFIHDVKQILGWLPKKKQTMLFSATMPPEIQALVNTLLHHPVRVAVSPVSSPVESIEQSVYFVDRGNKSSLLPHLIQTLNVKNALVFTRTKHGANRVARDLSKMGISASAIHGNKSQTARQQALSDFKQGKLHCLVATDIAARGLDIEELSHVFNYNLPEVPETYVHRIGRTGRAGRGGSAITLCEFGEKPLLLEIEKLTGRAIPVAENHLWPMVVLQEPKRDKNGRIINPIDEEARHAARGRQNARPPAQPAQKQPAAPISLSGETSSPSRQKSRHKKKGIQAPQEAAPVRTLRSVPLSEKQERTKLTRPGALMDTGDALPNTDLRHPDPLAGEEIMDATARLLAPKKRTDSSPARDAHQPRTAASGDKRGPGRSHPAPGTIKTEEASPAPQKRASANSSHANRGKSGSPSRGGRTAAEPRRSGQTKDSTEHQSLIKPYYLDIK